MHGYELSPEESHYYRQRLVDDQFEVFGKERMEESFGHEADEEDAERFKNTVEILCDEHDPLAPPRDSRLFRIITREGGPGLKLTTNPEDIHGFGNMSELDRSPAAVRDVKEGSLTLLKPRNGIAAGRYRTLEHMFIDRQTGEIKVEKELIPLVMGAQRSAVKLATKEELEEALDLITQAVASQDRR
jgi:hypothetical protein